MIPSAHLDTFARDNLPPRSDWPDFLFTLPELHYPDRLNCVSELLDRWIAARQGARPCIIAPSETLSYAQLAERVNRIANVLTRDLGLVPGNRVLLRAKELSYVVGKARSALRCVRRGWPKRWKRPRRSPAISSASCIGATAQPVHWKP